MQPYIGQIMVFAGTFAPEGYQLCDGSLLQISDNETLFRLLGTTYGGDGQSTFAVPDLRGRTPISQGTGPDAIPYTLGANGGLEQVALNVGQLPSHTHAANTTAAAGGADAPSPASIFADQGDYLAVPVYAPNAPTAQTALAPGSVTTAGGNQPHENRQPFLALTLCMATSGQYPSPS